MTELSQAVREYMGKGLEHYAGLERPMYGICAVGGCANGGTHLVSIPCRIDGRAGELDGVPICDDHKIEALAESADTVETEDDYIAWRGRAATP